MTMLAKRRWLCADAFSLLRWWHVLLQIALAAAVFLLAVVWLRLPDSSVFWLAISVLLGLALLFVAGGGEAALLLSIAQEPRTRGRLLRGAGIVLALAALWWGWTLLLAHHGSDDLRASFVNSRLPRRLRYIFTYSNLLLLQRCFWNAAAWIGTGVLAAALLPRIVVNRASRASGIALRSASFWVVLIAATLGTSFLTSAVLAWTPGHGLKLETLNLLLRLAVCAIMDAAVACLVLAMIAAAVRRAQAASKEGP